MFATRYTSRLLLTALAPAVILSACSESATGPDGATAVNWQNVIPQVETKVYQVLASYKYSNGQTAPLYPMGTEFAVATSFNRRGSIGGALATNAHVLEGIFKTQDLFAKNGITSYAFIVVRGNTRVGNQEGTYRITYGAFHAAYTGIQTTTQQSPDVALLQVDRDLPATVTIASDAELKSLNVGQPIAMLGFGVENGPASGDQPIGTFKNGTISALRPYNTSITATAESTRLIQHDMIGVGGSSGSPVFNAAGKVIAIHNSGDYISLPDGTRVASGAGSYAIRADEIRALFSTFGVNASVMAARQLP
jgi:V8-like Glu-specific endopeptidase